VVDRDDGRVLQGRADVKVDAGKDEKEDEEHVAAIAEIYPRQSRATLQPDAPNREADLGTVVGVAQTVILVQCAWPFHLQPPGQALNVPRPRGSFRHVSGTPGKRCPAVSADSALGLRAVWQRVQQRVQQRV